MKNRMPDISRKEITDFIVKRCGHFGDGPVAQELKNILNVIKSGYFNTDQGGMSDASQIIDYIRVLMGSSEPVVADALRDILCVFDESDIDRDLLMDYIKQFSILITRL
jgi:hypothetical protein